MARGKQIGDIGTLEMALLGFQIERQRIEEKMREIQAQLKGKSAVTASTEVSGAAPRAKRVLSAAARRRIAAAQRKRWAEHRKQMAQGGK